MTTIFIGFTSIIWGQLFAVLADNLSSESTKIIFGDWFYYDNSITYFYLFYIIGLAIALGLMVIFILWDFKDKFRRRLLIYIPFLILILGFSVYNYAHFDYIMRPDIQVVFNLIIIFLGLICSIQLWRLKTESTDGIVLKYIILFFLILCSVFIPFYFTISWFIQRVGLTAVNLSFNMPILTTIAGVVTSVITVLKYKDDKKKV